MRLTDPVADMLTRIRNSIRARHQKVDIPASKLKTEIARILKEEGYIANFKPAEEEGHKVLRVYLKYGNNNEAVITNLERVSRPGCRVYVRRTEIRACPRRNGNQHPDHAEGRDDGAPGAARRPRRRIALRGLVENKLLPLSF
jgi:small subunit ribosomal protein S8